jgi:hypothetical protein
VHHTLPLPGYGFDFNFFTISEVDLSLLAMQSTFGNKNVNGITASAWSAFCKIHQKGCSNMKVNGCLL